MSHPTHAINTGVSLPALRLILGLISLAISFYYSFKFLSVGASGFDLLSALAFVCITEATKAMYSHDIAYFSGTGQGDKTLFAALIVLILFALSITATVYFLLANPLKDDAKLSNSTHRTEQIKAALDAKQTQLSSCNANYLTKCVNPRTKELEVLQSSYDKALASETELSEIQANRAFWAKLASFAGSDSDKLQFYYAICRGVLLEVIGLALIAQATANKKILAYKEEPHAMRNNALDVPDNSAYLAEIEQLKSQLANNAPKLPTH